MSSAEIGDLVQRRIARVSDATGMPVMIYTNSKASRISASGYERWFIAPPESPLSHR
jgi:hypothetical protein